MATIQEHMNKLANTSKKTTQEAANILASKTGNTLTTQAAVKLYAGVSVGTLGEAIKVKATTPTKSVQEAFKTLSGL